MKHSMPSVSDNCSSQHIADSDSNYHVPVLLDQSLDLLDIQPDGVYVDLTFGGGGHSRHILNKLGLNGHLFAFDQDADACVIARSISDSRFSFIESNFRFLRSQLRARGVRHVNAVFADLGVSSHHFDDPNRGFSFRFDSLLDMRMNQRSTTSALSVLNNYDLPALTRILANWGELQTPHKIADCIIRTRTIQPIQTVAQLLDAVAPCTPKKDPNKFYSKLFQAIRIEVNHEMNALQMALEQAAKILPSGGRLVVIAYHSIEDRIVKNFMRSGNCDGIVTKDFFGNISTPFVPVTRKAIVPSDDEIARNPRARSAKLRAVTKL